MPFTLSYIIATRNRLPQLKITLGRLLQELQPDEEIVVVDGNSTDGTKEFLQQLFDDGRIHQFISEADHNQAHGWNKALLMASGTVIKKIIDDDVFSYAAISKCRDFMLKNPHVDVCISNDLTVDLLSPTSVQKNSRLKYFKDWQTGKTNCFTFSDVNMLIRKNALSYLGLYDTSFTMIDWEYALRCSYLKANIAYYTGYNSLSVNTPGNVTSTTSIDILKREGLIGKQKYGYVGDRSDISLYSEIKIAIGKAINYQSNGNKFNKPLIIPENNDISVLYNMFYETIADYNHSDGFEFIY